MKAISIFQLGRYITRMIGILAIQGGYKEHEEILQKLNLPFKEVRTLADAEGLSGFIIPGGESTVMDLFMKTYGLEKWLKKNAPALTVYGTCAGLILLARYGLLNVEVERNAYGRQSASFTTPAGHFIRAPKITRVGEGVEALAEYEGETVLVRQGKVWGSSFHPELAGETTLHARIFS